MGEAIRFNEETSRHVEALYLTAEVIAQRERTLGLLELKPGERVLDIGCGPGLLAYDMAVAVGPHGGVCGMDASEDMLAMSRGRCAEQSWTEFRRADAASLPYPDSAFDVGVSTQVYEYVADVPRALAELNRTTRPGGRVLVLDTDYGSLAINTANEPRMERMLDAWNEHFLHPALPRALSRLLRDAGFAVRRREALAMFTADYGADSYGKRLLGMMASFAVGRKRMSRHEADAWLAEFGELDRKGDFFFSLNRYLFVADKPVR